MLDMQLSKNLDLSLERLLVSNETLQVLSQPAPIAALCGGGVAEKLFMYYTLEGVLLAILKVTPAALKQPFETLKRQASNCLSKYQVGSAIQPAVYISQPVAGCTEQFIQWTGQRGIKCLVGSEELQRWVSEQGHSGVCTVPAQLRNAQILETTWGAHFYHWPQLNAVGLASTHTPVKKVDEWSFLKALKWALSLKVSRICLFVQTGNYLVHMFDHIRSYGIEEIYLLSTFLAEQDPVLIELESKHSAEPERYPFLNVVSWEEGVLAGLVNATSAMDSKITTPLQSIIEHQKVKEHV